MDWARIRRKRRARVRDHGDFGDVYGDELGNILGFRFARSNDCRYRFADEPHHAVRQNGLFDLHVP
ncbi:MAG TPA: hypothetical protein VJ353_00770, partial [Xanthobacteraceae bacterium]|nr:hypothetical protein [Xanthobacteraceae bacterium]